MRVVVGPVSNQSAKAWLRYAHTVLGEIAHDPPNACFSSPEVVRVFEDYVDQWDGVVRRAGEKPFWWACDVSDEQVKYHVHAFHQVVSYLAALAKDAGYRRSPLEGDEFYTVLVAALIDALGQGTSDLAEFAEHLSEFWPGPVSS
jgi:hypothetical protein